MMNLTQNPYLNFQTDISELFYTYQDMVVKKFAFNDTDIPTDKQKKEFEKMANRFKSHLDKLVLKYEKQISAKEEIEGLHAAKSNYYSYFLELMP